MASKAPKNWNGRADTLPADAFENYIEEQALVVEVATLKSRAKPGIDEAWLAVERILISEGEDSLSECVAICLARTLALAKCYHPGEPMRVLARMQKVLARLGIKHQSEPKQSQDYPAQSR